MIGIALLFETEVGMMLVHHLIVPSEYSTHLRFLYTTLVQCWSTIFRCCAGVEPTTCAWDNISQIVMPSASGHVRTWPLLSCNRNKARNDRVVKRWPSYSRIHINHGEWISPISQSILYQFSWNFTHTIFHSCRHYPEISRSFDDYLRS